MQPQPQPTRAVIDGRTGERRTFWSALRACSKFVLPVELPDLTRAEWQLILDVMKPPADLRRFAEPSDVAYRDEVLPNVVDGITEYDLDTKWAVRGDALIRKLKALTEEQWEQVRAVVDGFWESDGDVPRSRVPGKEN